MQTTLLVKISIGSNGDERVAVKFYRAKNVGHQYSKKLTLGKNSKGIFGVLKIRRQSRHSKEIDVERNHGERLYGKLLPTLYSDHAVGKHTLGTYGLVLTTAIDLIMPFMSFVASVDRYVSPFHEGC